MNLSRRRDFLSKGTVSFLPFWRPSHYTHRRTRCRFACLSCHDGAIRMSASIVGPRRALVNVLIGSMPASVWRHATMRRGHRIPFGAGSGSVMTRKIGPLEWAFHRAWRQPSCLDCPTVQIGPDSFCQSDPESTVSTKTLGTRNSIGRRRRMMSGRAPTPPGHETARLAEWTIPSRARAMTTPSPIRNAMDRRHGSVKLAIRCDLAVRFRQWLMLRRPLSWSHPVQNDFG